MLQSPQIEILNTTNQWGLLIFAMSGPLQYTKVKTPVEDHLATVLNSKASKFTVSIV